jgi:uncharacterized membrane protein YraQ (UPF0718 family)
VKQAIEDENKSKEKSYRVNLVKVLRIVIVLGLSLGGLSIFFPQIISKSLQISGKYGIEMLLVFPAFLVLMGLADVWIPKELINKYLGQESGLKGILLAIFLGTLPTGPMYIALPIAGELLRKKASLVNVITFLGVWASLKVPQIGVEIQFLGVKFAALRFVFTLASVIIIGFIIDYMTRGEIEFVKE